MLEVDSVTKSYGAHRVLHDVSFSVAPGSMTGFVGANGAGKTTTMRIILGVLAADAGTVRFEGSTLTAADRRRFGYMPEERGLYPKMRVLEQLSYFARLHGWSQPAADRNAGELLERLGLTERANDMVESLSLGNQQRTQIAAALVHRPEVLVLDEPFSGLDPLAVDTVQDVLSDFARSGAPVLFSSHQLDIVERLCDDLVIIADGGIRAAGATQQLREQHGSRRYILQTGTDAAWVSGIPGVTVVSATDQGVVCETESDAALWRLLQQAVERRELVSFGREHIRLAQIFREVIQ